MLLKSGICEKKSRSSICPKKIWHMSKGSNMCQTHLGICKKK